MTAPVAPLAIDPDGTPTARRFLKRLSTRPSGRPRIRLPYLLIVPALVALAVGIGYPFAWQIVTSFKEYGLAQQFGNPAEFAGLANYIELVTDKAFWVIALRSVIFCLVTAAATMVIGIALAVLMRYISRGARITLQIALLLAWAMPVVAQMTVWTWLVEDRNGVVNYVLSLLPGVDMIGHNWLVEPLSFFFVASVIITWASVPFVAFSVYAGFTTISREVEEAASIDGAHGFMMLRTIMLPIVKPVLAIVLLLQLIWDLRVFAQIKLLQDAGSFGSQYDLLGTFIYKLGTGAQNFGLASAAAIVVMILTLGLSGAYVRHLLKEDATA